MLISVSISVFSFSESYCNSVLYCNIGEIYKIYNFIAILTAILLSLRWAGTFVPLPSPQIYLSLCRIPLHMELYKLHLYILFTLFFVLPACCLFASIAYCGNIIRL